MREKYTVQDRVPIHEIRKIIQDKYGDKAASHLVFDSTMNELRLNKNMRLVSIDDLSRYKPEHLQDSIHTNSGLLFYINRRDRPA
jgi:hypothetical protein